MNNGKYVRKDLCCKDCFYFNRFDFCTIRSDMIAKCNRDDPICIGFKFKNDYPIEKLGSLEEMLSESIKDCLNKESMIPRKKTIEERISELEQKVRKLEKQINELDGSVKATYM